MQSFVLMGLESAGKSTLFNILTESAASDERNFRGSTVVCREGLINDAGICLVDTPGIRFQSDSETTKLALDALNQHDGILVVLRPRTLSRSGKRSVTSYRHRQNTLLYS
ncbi:Fe2+ transport system protein B [Klebsiella pneumoniae subsp. ozaenae]|uniref:Fe2+ transport system protein B n=1 Tax=Klebsiella pneumoniae subsp. ozaenae TaxID=574 RepID=A0A377ZCJ5_KLEPO|nr:Fe2+ transport system protein B [Klebsiella pneumoniae subsp. ozaenae]